MAPFVALSRSMTADIYRTRVSAAVRAVMATFPARGTDRDSSCFTRRAGPPVTGLLPGRRVGLYGGEHLQRCRVYRRLGTTAQAELGEDGAHVVLNRAHRVVQLPGDLGVG